MNRVICVLAVFWMVAIGLAGCGPSQEERTVLNQFNQLPELIEKGGYVKEFERFEGQEEKVFVVEAQIVNEEGIAIGRLRSERVEGFGTRKPRIQWYKTPGVVEEWDWERFRGRRGEGRRGGDQQNRPVEGEARPPENQQ